MTKDEALKLALEYVELVPDDRYNAEHIDREALVTAIKEALMSVPDGAQPEHGWTPERIAGIVRLKEAQDKKLAQRTWVELTDKEIFSCENSVPDEAVTDRDWCIYFVRAIEAKLKEKNT